MACSHLSSLTFKPPTYSQSVYKEECTQCFDTQDGADGVDVCLTCFNGGCPATSTRAHARIHATKQSHPLVVNVKRTVIPPKPRPEGEPPLKKLAIQEDTTEYEYKTTIKCYGCSSEGLVLDEHTPNLYKAMAQVEAITSHMSSAQQSEVKAWEEEITTCEHCLTLSQLESKTLEPSGLAHCSACDLTGNLWLCLTCGNLACGRQQFGGVGGNGHALSHFQAANHPIAVKLGTITPEGTADIYCYDCNDARIDPILKDHLANFGIQVADQVKTEKSMTELQVEQNLKFDFAMTGEDGKSLQPLFGPALTGLQNLGNSCYMASTLQSLFSLPQFVQRYYARGEQGLKDHAWNCNKAPADCIECQMLKVADGLLSGRYSVPAPRSTSSPVDGATDTDPVFQKGIKPSMFKALIGKNHEEFATMRQQDADEFLKHLLTTLERALKNESAKVTDSFKFEMETRLQCANCKGVKYRKETVESLSVPVPAREVESTTDAQPPAKTYQPVSLEECLGLLTGQGEVEYKCPQCQKQVVAVQSTKFATVPNVLVVHARRFQLVNWVPQKVDVPIEVHFDTTSLGPFFSAGEQPGETVLPESESDEASSSQLPEFNVTALSQLEAMGFPTIRAQKALLATGNSDAEVAMVWLLEHMEDPDIDAPLSTIQAQGGSNASPDQISMIVDMGFTPAQANKALRETSGSVERAIEWLFSHPDDMGDEAGDSGSTESQPKATFGTADQSATFRLKSFISHKGPSVHSGHYVSHVHTESNGWVLFNDEKVVKADGGAQSAEKLAPFAYVYIFERI